MLKNKKKKTIKATKKNECLQARKYDRQCKYIDYDDCTYILNDIWVWCKYKNKRIYNCGSCPYYGQLEITFNEQN